MATEAAARVIGVGAIEVANDRPFVLFGGMNVLESRDLALQVAEAYVETCKPPILSYDNYPIGEGGGFSYGFWANISDIRTVAVKHNIPFWTIVLTSALSIVMSSKGANGR